MSVRAASLLALSLMYGSAFADVIILTNGQTVEWRTLKDNGDSYEVQTADAKTIMILKKDIKELKVGSAGASPLTGATFTENTKAAAPLDLIALIDPSRDAVHGIWKKSGASLVSANPGAQSAFPRLQIQYVPPPEYDLSMVVERKEGENDFALGLVAEGKQFCLRLDGWQSAWSGMDLIDGQDASQTQNHVAGRFFTNGKPRMIAVSVRKEWLRVTVDGKEFLSLKGDWASRMSLQTPFAVKDPRYLFLASSQGTYQVSRVTLTPRK